MRVGSFSLLIPEGVERSNGYVGLAHATQYTVRLGNHGHRRCDAEVWVDGKPIGTYRVNAGCTVTLERAAHDAGRFTFFRAESAEGGAAGAAGVDAPARGLVQVIFRPERQAVRLNNVRARTCGGPGPQSVPKGVTEYEERTAGGLVPGVTGLTGHSNQAFVEVPDLDHDPAGEVTISLRLVADAGGVRELAPAPRANPVPPPVG